MIKKITEISLFRNFSKQTNPVEVDLRGWKLGTYYTTYVYGST